MIILLLVALIAFNIWLIRTHAPNTFRRSTATDAEPGHQNPAGTSAPQDDNASDTDAEPRAWTALDDHQLNRLLKDSSP
jgi:hypothetical protein